MVALPLLSTDSYSDWLAERAEDEREARLVECAHFACKLTAIACLARQQRRDCFCSDGLCKQGEQVRKSLQEPETPEPEPEPCDVCAGRELRELVTMCSACASERLEAMTDDAA